MHRRSTQGSTPLGPPLPQSVKAPRRQARPKPPRLVHTWLPSRQGVNRGMWDYLFHTHLPYLITDLFENANLHHARFTFLRRVRDSLGYSTFSEMLWQESFGFHTRNRKMRGKDIYICYLRDGSIQAALLSRWGYRPHSFEEALTYLDDPYIHSERMRAQDHSQWKMHTIMCTTPVRYA